MIIFIFITLIFLSSGTILAQHPHGSDSTKTEMKKMGCCKNMDHSKHEMKMGKDMHPDMKMESHTGMGMDSIKSKDQSIVREGEINLEAIDANKDGKVYQDMMDWNVISDKPGKCPICGMELKEVAIKKAKENLTKHGFEVKE